MTTQPTYHFKEWTTNCLARTLAPLFQQSMQDEKFMAGFRRWKYSGGYKKFMAQFEAEAK